MKKMLLPATLALALGAAYGQDERDPDRRKSAAVVYLEGLRFETEKPVDLSKAVAKYAKALKKAEDEKNEKVAAETLARLAACAEKMEPENIDEAQRHWQAIADKYGSVEPYASAAKEKLSFKGIDVWLTQFAGTLRAWRDVPGQSMMALIEPKNNTWGKFQKLDKGAVDGLIWGLGHADEIVREFTAEKFAEVTDGDGILKVIGRLNDPKPDMRAGAAAALRQVFKKFTEAAALDRAARELEQAIDMAILGAKPKAIQDGLKAQAGDRKKKAAEIRHNIPDSVPEIQGALEKIIADDGADAQARVEAAGAARSIGRISGGLAEALLAGMKKGGKDRKVREACARAAGEVDHASPADRRKLTDRLIEVVTYDPAREADAEAADWANDGPCRQAAAEALEKIALIKALPALIKALGDNDALVRAAAHRSLREITEKDFGYEPDAPLKDTDKQKGRESTQKDWEKWWNDTGGVVVLVERFWKFQSKWEQLDRVKLFSPDVLLKETESKKWITNDYKSLEDRVKRAIDAFQRAKEIFVQDAVDLGPEAFDRLLKFIGGETDKEKSASSATRLFVAESCARSIVKNGIGNGAEKLRDLVANGDSAAKKTGAAVALGLLPKDRVGSADREALQTRGLTAPEPEVREASADALARVGEEGSASDLNKVATDPNAGAQIAALRALASIHAKNMDTVRILGELVADEPEGGGGASKRSSNPLVREYAVDALGEIGDAGATLALLRACRDTMRNVREAAIKAVRKLYKADPSCTKTAVDILTDEKKKTDDRKGAAHFLGYAGDAMCGKVLVLRLVDENPPLKLRDPDAEVRIAVCRALGDLGAKTVDVVKGLIDGMADENERQGVRDEAFQGLKAVTGLNPEKTDARSFRASDPREKRETAVAAWRSWFDAEKPNLRGQN